MRDVVSGWIHVVLLAASLSVVSAVFAAGYVWTGLAWLTLASSVALALISRASSPSLSDAIRAVEAVPALAVRPVPKSSSLKI